jgi:hypothetical protein
MRHGQWDKIRVEEAQILVARYAALRGVVSGGGRYGGSSWMPYPRVLGTIQTTLFKLSRDDDIPCFESKWDQDQSRLRGFRRTSGRGRVRLAGKAFYSPTGREIDSEII